GMTKWISLLASTLLALAAPAGQAQQPPVPPLVRIIVPSAPGASTDLIARAIAPQLAARLGTNVIVDNRAGASGMLGASAVAKVQIRHIPYKGTAPAVVDLISGNIDMIIATGSTLASQVKSGRVRLIGVTSRQPSAAFPGLPTMNTVAPGYEAGLWVGMWVA